MTPWPWEFFTPDEMRCKETGACFMDAEFMGRLDELRRLFGKPLAVTSGFRSVHHSKELVKEERGPHTYGKAADLAVQGGDALQVVRLALGLGFTGIGVHQKGKGRFIHVDTMMSLPGAPRPWIWSY